MIEASKLSKATETAAKSWPSFREGDPNSVDVYWLAQKIREELGVLLPTDLPAKTRGVQAFESVEKNLLRDLPGNGLIRNSPLTEIARRIETLYSALKDILPFLDDHNLVVSLYAWHGCILMGKLLRCTYNIPGGQALYTAEQRREGYAHVEAEWQREESQGNPWVRYGVSLARPMEQGRKGENFDYEIHENWVPKDSPYWEK